MARRYLNKKFSVHMHLRCISLQMLMGETAAKDELSSV